MILKEIIKVLEAYAPTVLQEAYDNAGLITGSYNQECTGIICSLDATELVIEEAIQNNCNLVLSHHPIVFNGIKRLNGTDYIERAVIKAIKHDIAIYAIHTNLDNVINGVNGRIADTLGLVNRQILHPKTGLVHKLCTFVPVEYAEQVLNALFEAGAGRTGLYSECSFTTMGKGTFKAGEGAKPFIGEVAKRHEENELKLEVTFASWRQQEVIAALKKSHPYEEIAFDLLKLDNNSEQTGSGLLGDLPDPILISDFFQKLKEAFGLAVIRHSQIIKPEIQRIAICGGAGSFLTKRAIASGADVYLSSDYKYHEFFDADGKIIIADIGHWESEQFTVDLLVDIIKANFPTFAVLKSKIRTNPVHYFT